MKWNLRLEELAQFGLSIFLFGQLDYAWWWYLVLILTPDIGMIGYAVNSAFGAFTYNLFHHKGIAVLIGLAGWVLGLPNLYLAGIILFGHAAMDRFMGYGLKYPDHFKHTHLGQI